MSFPVPAPVPPMLAKRVATLPEGDWLFEPKWDGFRVIVFRDNEEVLLQSRDTKPLNRYFPDLVQVLLKELPERVVLDGEIVIAHDGVLDFDALQMRIHPAASRVKSLAQALPAAVVFFDVLASGDRDLRSLPFQERRAELERLLSNAQPPVHITPLTRNRAVAGDWFQRFEGAGLDGVMAKSPTGAYEPNKRVMLKVKHERECDCVVAGFRWHKGGEDSAIGSLLLGLYDDTGQLQHVGVVASFTAAKRRELLQLLTPYRDQALERHPWRSWAAPGGDDSTSGRMPGGKSRWSQGKDLSWQALRPELVVEVAYDHMQGTRFRHTAQFRRWRPDKATQDCTYAQLEVIAPEEVAHLFGSG